MKLKIFYQNLYNWWECNKRVLPWRETTDPYCIWLSEVILQQTRVAQGMEYYYRFVNRWPSVTDLANATEDEVLREWQGLGYYSRARNLHKAAQTLSPALTGTFLPKGEKEQNELYAMLRSLPGVGDYTAGAIAAFAYDLPYPALDGNVYRVLSRLYDCDIAFDTTAGKKHFHALAEDILDREHPRLFNSAIMEFGALYCTPLSPDCTHCPIVQHCLAYANHTAQVLPVRKPRPSLRDRYLIYRVYIGGEKIDPTLLIHQRTGQDIWKHLWEFPLEESDHLPEDESASMVLDYTHVLSHQRLHARFFVYKVKKMPAIAGEKLIHRSELDDYALSRLTLRALEDITM